MNSGHLQTLLLRQAPWDWKKWIPKVVRSAPDATGIYFFRFAGGKPISRVKGESDIVYIGQGNIQHRLTWHENQNWHIALLARLHSEGLEVNWLELSAEDAKQRETELLGKYFLEHYESPPVNRSLPEQPEDVRMLFKLYGAPEGVAQSAIRSFLKKRSLLPNNWLF